MLQSPGYMTTTASRGMQVPTYAYAANNPLRYVDPTGLYSWRLECGPSSTSGLPRGFTITKDTVFNRIWINPNSGWVGFDNSETTACEDLAWMKQFERSAHELEPIFYNAFTEAADCWADLKAQIKKKCDEEKKPNHCPPPVHQSPNPKPLPS